MLPAKSTKALPTKPKLSSYASAKPLSPKASSNDPKASAGVQKKDAAAAAANKGKIGSASVKVKSAGSTKSGSNAGPAVVAKPSNKTPMVHPFAKAPKAPVNNGGGGGEASVKRVKSEKAAAPAVPTGPPKRRVHFPGPVCYLHDLLQLFISPCTRLNIYTI